MLMTSLEVFSKTQLNARLAIQQRADFFGANISESGLRFPEVGKGTLPCFFLLESHVVMYGT